MSVVLWLGVAWLVLAPVGAVVLGTAIRQADHRDAARPARPENEPVSAVPSMSITIPWPRSAEIRRRLTRSR